MDFYKYLNYSLGNEDWHVEAQALRVAPGDKVVCVTASGDRALHLLMTDCAEIISIDMNQAQNHLLSLKLAAITHLDFESYLAFLGCAKSSHRQSFYKQVRPHLPSDAALFWDQHSKLLSKGIIYQGKVERLTSLSGKFFNLTYGKKIKKLFAFDNLEEQREFVIKEWNTFILRKIFETIINPNITKYLISDPGLNSYLDYKPGPYIYERMLRYLNNHLAKDSVLMQLLFTGQVTANAYFPYLTFSGYTAIRKNVERLNYRTTNIVELLNDENFKNIDCFSMSDIASYMPQDVFERLLYGIQNAAKPNARFCIREFMSNRYIPANLKNNFKRDTALEQKLEMEETNFVYRFMVGEVHR